MSLGNREGGEDEDAEPEELPDWNAVSSLRETGRRDETFISYTFLPESKKAFCFAAMVTIRRFLPYFPMALLETKCGCTHSVSWSSVFVTRVSNKLMSNTSLRMAYDSRYKNAVVHGCIWYKQNAPLRDREIPHLDTHEDKFLRSSAY